MLLATARSTLPESQACCTLALLADEMVQLTEHDSLSRATGGRRLPENEPVVPTRSCGKRTASGLRVRLPNGIEISLSLNGHDEDALLSLLRLLCTLPCSLSTRP